jgi:hypothetical protein
MSLLATYEEQATTMTACQLEYAIKDIRKAWAANPDFEDTEGPNAGYARKLWAEFDAYTVELQKRRRPPK